MRRVALIAVLAIGGSIAGHLLGSPAAATNFGSSNCGPNVYLSYCIADNSIHNVYLAGLNSNAIRTDTAWILDQQYDNLTQLSAQVVTGSVYDVRAWDQSYGDTGYWGATYCPSTSTEGGTDPLRWCKPHYIRYNVYYANKFDSAQERQAIACHELGHTVGLRHSLVQNSCMKDPVVTNGIDGHDKALIDQQY